MKHPILQANEALLRRMDDLAERAKKSGAAHSKFLTPAEQAVVLRHFKNRADVLLALDSGIGQPDGAGAGRGAGAGAATEAGVGAGAGAAVGAGSGAADWAAEHAADGAGGGRQDGGERQDGGQHGGNRHSRNISDGGQADGRQQGGGQPDGGGRRCVAIFAQPEWGAYERDAILAAFEAGAGSREPIGHRDVLGALMSSGVERETIGEIVADGAPAYFVCLASVAPFIRDSVAKIGRAPGSPRSRCRACPPRRPRPA
ncbi:MAG: hypothetical protein LBL83_02995 [Clostridiales bacterium]|jgi:hypothetical protein|nr:hypothetical protein [Clostridiales bacterium]